MTVDADQLDPWCPDVRRVVVVAPHPDDEVFALGGFMHDLAARGVDVTVIAVTDGEGAYGPLPWPTADALVRRRVAERAQAYRRLGAPRTTVIRLGLRDGRVAEHEARLTGRLGPLLRHATTVAAPWAHDGHPDHEATARAVEAAATDSTAVASYFVWAWLATPRDVRMGGSLRLRRWSLGAEARRAKHHAIAAFRSQLGPSPHGEAVVPALLLEALDRDAEVVAT